jgi:chemotaxis methyl-accepting protein methylase
MGRFDVIFCRNVLIYFDKPTQAAILQHFAAACSRMVCCSWDIPKTSSI